MLLLECFRCLIRVHESDDRSKLLELPLKMLISPQDILDGADGRKTIRRKSREYQSLP